MNTAADAEDDNDDNDDNDEDDEEEDDEEEEEQGMRTRARTASRGQSKDLVKALMHVLCLMFVIAVWSGNAADATGTAADDSAGPREDATRLIGA